MPCRVDMPEPKRVDQSLYLEVKSIADNLTRENDELRELVLALNSGANLTKAQRDKILKDQIAHRKEDLKRLKQVFTDNKDATKLGKVILADPKKPLKPQLGFDPDQY